MSLPRSIMKKEQPFIFAEAGRNPHSKSHANIPGIRPGMAPDERASRGNCLIHPEPFRLGSDTVHWSVKVNAGGDAFKLALVNHHDRQISLLPFNQKGSAVLARAVVSLICGCAWNDFIHALDHRRFLRINGTSLIEVDVTKLSFRTIFCSFS